MPFVPATQAQQDYLAILFIDCGFTRRERNAWLGEETSRDIKFLDDLSSTEASAIINKAQRDQGREARETEAGGDRRC